MSSSHPSLTLLCCCHHLSLPQLSMTTEDITRNPPTHPSFLKAITLAQQWEAPCSSGYCPPDKAALQGQQEKSCQPSTCLRSPGTGTTTLTP